MNIRSVGITTNGTRGVDDGKTLSECKFLVGDYIDVAITPARLPNRGGPGDFQRRPNDSSGRRFDRFNNSDRDRRY